jgi:hypothetical protein
MTSHGPEHPASAQPEPPVEGLILEGAPPGSGRPSWLALVIAVVIAIGAGAALGYGVAAPRPTATPSPSPSLRPTPVPTAFVASPCDLLAAVPFTQLPAFTKATTVGPVTSVIPGMRSCEVLNTATMQVFGQVLLRQLPTSQADFTVVAGEVFQGDDVTPSSFGTTPGIIVPCSHFWSTCHPAAVFVHAPYFVVVALEPGRGDAVAIVRELATRLLELGFGSGQPVPTLTATPVPTVAGFLTFNPPAADAAWSGLAWLRLSAGDTQARVSFTLRWSRGYIAIGQATTGADSARTPVWASSDGVLWYPLDPDVFGSSTIVAGIAEGPNGLVALSGQAATNGCALCWTIANPIQAWTSSDGTSWTAHPGPDLALPASPGNPRLVVGPAGFLAAVPDEAGPGGSGPTQAAISADGVTWQTLSPDTFPAGFRLSDVYGTSTGYLAVGAQEVDPEHEAAAALWSTDGRSWVVTGPMQIASRTGVVLAASQPSWTAGTIVAGSGGFIVTGGVEAAPGAQLWWQSSDGQHWQALSGYPPLGAQPGEGEGAGGQPYGVLVGDGQRIIAVRGGPQAAAWSSADGRTWTTLAIGGDVPSEQAAIATLFPGGVLLSDGTTSWYGRATTG